MARASKENYMSGNGARVYEYMPVTGCAQTKPEDGEKVGSV